LTPSAEAGLSPIFCRHCASAGSRFDLFCGSCGRPLAELEWRSQDGSWHSDRGTATLTLEGDFARLALRNRGVVPAWLKVTKTDLGQASWLEIEPLRRQVWQVPAGSEHYDLELSLSRDEAQRQLTALGRTALAVSFHVLGWPQVLELQLSIARHAWISPAGCQYRFLALERLERGFDHEVEVHAGNAVGASLEALPAVDEPLELPEGYWRLSAEELLPLGRGEPVPDGAESWRQTLRFQAPLRERLQQPACFDLRLPYALVRGAERQTLSSRLCGVVGRGPTLVQTSPRGICFSAPYEDRNLSVELSNPGHLPVRLLSIECWQGASAGERVEGPDWLAWSGLEPGTIVPPGGTARLELRIEPHRLRHREAADHASLWRRLRLAHDGWQADAEDRTLELLVEAQFGRTFPATVGIDFGTSNSVVYLLAGERGHDGFALTLEQGRARDADQLASVLFFRGDLSASEPVERRFHFGNEALNAYKLEPSNLVRGIKTLIRHDRRACYPFVTQVNGRRIPQSVGLQQLLDLFVVELRDRGERFFDPLAHSGPAGESRRPVLTGAVFSHPVEATESMLEALFEAAGSAGLAEGIASYADFAAGNCLDEASAAALAYTHLRLRGGLQVPELVQGLDCEHLLCIDIGAGTTDLAAVEIEGFRALLDGGSEPIRFRLRATGGDGDFGGDRLDREVALLLLAQLKAELAKVDEERALEPVLQALSVRSFADFQVGLATSRAARGERNGNGLPDAGELWARADELRSLAREAKHHLGEHDTFTAQLDGSSWLSLLGDRGRAPLLASFSLSLERTTLQELFRGQLKDPWEKCKEVLAAAGWAWEEVHTVLLTGQSFYSPLLRDPLCSWIEQSRAGAAGPFHVVAPGQGSSSFDPKVCVALGAAVLDRNSEDLVIERASGSRLGFDLQRERFKGLITVPGLEHGSSLPATATLSFRKAVHRLTLFRGKRAYVRFELPRPATELKLRVASASELWAESGDEKIRGELL
jgi:molecular chaperone DnaK (HSP70)